MTSNRCEILPDPSCSEQNQPSDKTKYAILNPIIGIQSVQIIHGEQEANATVPTEKKKKGKKQTGPLATHTNPPNATEERDVQQIDCITQTQA